MSHNYRAPLAILIGLTVLVCGVIPAIGYVGFNVTKQPEPTALVLNTQTPSPTQVAGTATPAPVCGGPAAMFILLVGSDSRADNYYYGLSDSMRIVRADFVHPGLMFLPFQRDLYVEIPGVSEHAGITHGKLNQAYLYGNPGFGYYKGQGQGPGLLAETMRQNFGARVDHYVAVNLHSFVRVVDALGGVDVDLPSPVDGRSRGSTSRSLYFPAGQQHLDGARALTLARLRPDGDLERTARQNLILKALIAKILSPSTLPKMPKVVEAFYNSVQTDLGANEIVQLLCLGSMIKPQDVQALDFPAELFTGSRVHDPVLGYTFVWDVNFDMLRAYVEYFNKGTWPQTPLPEP